MADEVFGPANSLGPFNRPRFLPRELHPGNPNAGVYDRVRYGLYRMDPRFSEIADDGSVAFPKSTASVLRDLPGKKSGVRGDIPVIDYMSSRIDDLIEVMRAGDESITRRKARQALSEATGGAFDELWGIRTSAITKRRSDTKNNTKLFSSKYKQQTLAEFDRKLLEVYDRAGEGVRPVGANSVFVPPYEATNIRSGWSSVEEMEAFSRESLRTEYNDALAALDKAKRGHRGVREARARLADVQTRRENFLRRETSAPAASYKGVHDAVNPEDMVPEASEFTATANKAKPPASPRTAPVTHTVTETRAAESVVTGAHETSVADDIADHLFNAGKKVVHGADEMFERLVNMNGRTLTGATVPFPTRRGVLRGVKKVRSTFDTIKDAADYVVNGRMMADIDASVMGTVSGHEKQLIESIIKSPDGLAVGQSELDIAWKTIGTMKDPDELFELAHMVDPQRALAAQRSIPAAHTNKLRTAFREIIKERVVKTPVTSLNRAFEDGTVATVTGKLTKVQRTKLGRAKSNMSRILDGLVNKQAKNMSGDVAKVITERHQMQIAHLGIGGVAEIRDFGAGPIGRRVFDPAGHHTLSELARTLDPVDDVTGRIKPGVQNIFGLDLESIVKLRQDRAFIENGDMLSLDLQPGRLLGFKINRAHRGYTSAGKRDVDVTAYHYATLTKKELAARKALAKEAYKKELSFDIETGHGLRNRKTSLRQAMDNTEVLEDALNIEKPFMGIQDDVAQEQIKKFYGLIGHDGGRDDVAAWKLYQQMRNNEDLGVDWITQAAFSEFRHGKDVGSSIGTSIHDGTTALGKSHFGRRARVNLSAAEWERGVDRLIDAAKQKTVVSGLNVGQFDMRVSQWQTSIMGEAYLSRWNMFEKDWQIYGDLLLEGHDTTDVAKRMMTTTGAKTLEQAQTIAGRWKARAGKFLATAGRYVDNGEGGYYRFADEAPVREYLETHGFKGLRDPIMHAIDNADYTALYRRFNVNSVGGIDSWNKVVETRVKAHVMGLELDGTTAAGKFGNKEALSSLTRDIWMNPEDIVEGDVIATLGKRSRRVFSSSLSADDVMSFVEGLEREGFDEKTTTMLKNMFHKGARIDDLDEIVKTVDPDLVNRAFERMRVMHGERTVEAIKLKLIQGAGASQEAVLYTNESVFNSVARGLKAGKERFWGMAAHLADRDTFMSQYVRDAAWKSMLETGKEVVRVTRDAAEMAKEAALGLVGRLTVAGYRNKDVQYRGAAPLAVSTATEHVLGESESLSATAREALGSKFVPNVIDDVRNMAGPVWRKGVERTYETLKHVLPEGFGIDDAERLAKGGIGLTAAAVVAAGLIVAGTTYRERHQDDEVWKYAQVESPIERELNKRRRINTTLGSYVTQSSVRSNYSYNMRSDKHKHLFRG